MTSLPTLSTDALSMSYGQRQVIRELGVSLPSGQVTALPACINPIVVPCCSTATTSPRCPPANLPPS